VSANHFPALNRTAKWFALGALAGMLAADMRLGNPSDPSWWLLALIFLPWEFGPVLLAALLVNASRTAAGQWLFFLLMIAFILASAETYREVLVSTSSTASVALVIYPLGLYAAFLVVAAIAALCGWRTRPDFPRREVS
jgi:hypothetical protein